MAAVFIGEMSEVFAMDIKILGPGCPRCEDLMKRTINVLAELNIAANVEKVADIKQIVAYGIMATPALVINGKVKCAGRIPPIEDIRAWIQEVAACLAIQVR
jgi:small redox-active disulfide protein 2